MSHPITIEGKADEVVDTGRYLVEYDDLCRRIAEEASVDKLKDIIDIMVARACYARKAKNKQLEADSAVIRMRATRQLDKLRQAQAATIGLATGTRGQLPERGDAGRFVQRGGLSGIPPRDEPPTLAEAGIGKNLAHQGRVLGALSDEEFEARAQETHDRIASAVDREMRRAINVSARSTTKATIPPGRYSCIVIDPPWPMQKIERDVRPNQVGFDYPTMSEEELADFDVQAMAADDCHLFCWTTQRFLLMAIRLIEGWGFNYVFEMVWHKPGGFQPIGLPQYNCEFAIYAQRGSPKFVETTDFFTCFQALRREHSRKPDKFYDVIRRVTPEPRIDVFSREARPGFAQYGNETTKFGQAAE